MLQCAIIAGQLFLLDPRGAYINFNHYTSFRVSEIWGEYHILAESYERADQYKVDGVVTNEMIPAVLNKCAETAK